MIDFLKQLPDTFYSRAFYRDLYRRNGIGYAFIFVIFIVCFITASFHMHKEVKEFSSDMQHAFSNMPGTTVKNKKLSIDKPVPYEIDLFKENDKALKLMFDTSFKTNRFDKVVDYMEEKDVFVLVTSDKIATRGLTPKGKFDMRDLDMNEGSYTHDQWAQMGKDISHYLYPVALVLIACGLFLWTHVAIFLMTLVTMSIGFIMKMELGFDAAMRITASTGIPVALLGCILFLPILPVVLIWAGYAIFAINCIKTAKSNVG